MQAEALRKKLDYWKQKLAGAPELLELPADYPRPADLSARRARAGLHVPAAVADALRAIGQAEDATLFMTLAAAFNAFLHRYTGRDDLVIASPAASRGELEHEPGKGFVNTLPLRTDASGDPAFVELLGRARAVVLEAYAHQEAPFEKIVEALQRTREPGYHPIFQILFAFQTPLEANPGDARLDLVLALAETPEGLTGWFEYATDLFVHSRMERMALNFQTLLAGIAAAPRRHLSELPLLALDEERLVLSQFNATARPFPEDGTVVELFENQAAQNPRATALVCGGERLTYAELNSRASQLASDLRALGVGPEVLAGVCLERSIDMVVGILGVLKAGGAYVPMDPAYPPERLAFMVRDANSPVILTQQKLLDRLPMGLSKIICLDGGEWPARSRPAAEPNPWPAPAARHLAYVIYTSGSTGRPKGVALEHRSLNALVHWAREVYSAEELAGVLFVTSICFDLSVFEMFVPLCWGGKIILAETSLDCTELPAAREVTLANTVPSLMAEWLRRGGLPDSVRTVNLAGEPLAQTLVEQIYERCPSVQQIYDLYGPTEDTVYSTFARRTRGGRTTIGRPLSNEQIYLLDRAGQPVPLGVPGEIYIGGSGLARGYLNQPAMTGEKFLPNPFAAGGRFYRTGDLARYYEDGSIQFLGRLDHQVKIRGFRIELGEVEAQLRQHPAVRETLVLAREDDHGEKQLIAYVVPEEHATLDSHGLREFLRQKLPLYMVPARFIPLQAFPLTPNGKIDRQALPLPDAVRPELQKDFVAPRTDLEQLLAGIWCEVLSLQKVGVYDHFFELGGHSLLVTQMLSRVRDILEVDLPLRAVFETPTIASLAQLAEQLMVEEINQLSEEEAQRLSETLETPARGGKH